MLTVDRAALAAVDEDVRPDGQRGRIGLEVVAAALDIEVVVAVGSPKDHLACATESLRTHEVDAVVAVEQELDIIEGQPVRDIERGKRLQRQVDTRGYPSQRSTADGERRRSCSRKRPAL